MRPRFTTPTWETVPRAVLHCMYSDRTVEQNSTACIVTVPWCSTPAWDGSSCGSCSVLPCPRKNSPEHKINMWERISISFQILSVPPTPPSLFRHTCSTSPLCKSRLPSFTHSITNSLTNVAFRMARHRDQKTLNQSVQSFTLLPSLLTPIPLLSLTSWCPVNLGVGVKRNGKVPLLPS